LKNQGVVTISTGFILQYAADTENPFKSREKAVILHKICKTHRYAV